MAYGNFTKPAPPYYMSSKKVSDSDFTSAYFLNPSANRLSRSGSNHRDVRSTKTTYQKLVFSKDGSSVKVIIGDTKIPIRKYRWVGSGKNRRKVFYIHYVTRHVHLDIPRPKFSYRGASRNNSALMLLTPNSLNTSWKEETNGPPLLFSMLGGSLPNRFLYEVNTSGFLRNRIDPAVPRSVTSRFDPYQTFDITIPSPSMKALEDDALRSLYEKVASRFPDVGTMVGESKESLSMLRKLANEGCSFVADLLKKDKKRLAGRLNAPAKAISDAWLTYVYGVRPLIQDIESLQNLPNQYGLRTYTSKRTYYQSGTHSVSQDLVKTTTDFMYRVDVRYGVIMSADLRGTQRLAAMNLLNPIGVGYNLIPFSFMLDWFYDLGSFLNNQSALQYGFLYGWKTVTINKHRLPLQTPSSFPAASEWRLPPGLAFRQRIEEGSCVRTVLSKTQFPQLPTPKLDLWQDSSIRGLNALAIAISQHKS